MAASDYGSRLRWMRVSNPTEPVYGSKPKTHSFNGKVWASIEETNSRADATQGNMQSGADATIRVSDYPTITTLDLLEDTSTGYVWHINGIANGDSEIILDCYRNDNLVDWVFDD